MLDHGDAIREFVAQGASVELGRPIMKCPMIDNPNKLRALAAFIALGANLSGMLHKSVERHQMVPLRMLVEGGAPLAERINGKTPLAIAVFYTSNWSAKDSFAEIEAYLRSRGAPL